MSSHSTDPTDAPPRGVDPSNELHKARGDVRREIVWWTYCQVIEEHHHAAADCLRQKHPVPDQAELAYELCAKHLDGWVPDKR